MADDPLAEIVQAQSDGYGSWKCPQGAAPLMNDPTQCFKKCTYANIQVDPATCTMENGESIELSGNNRNPCCAPPPPADSAVANPKLHPLLNLSTDINTDDPTKPYCPSTFRRAVVREQGQSKNACFAYCNYKTKDVSKDPVFGCMNTKFSDTFTEQVTFPIKGDKGDEPTCCALEPPPNCKPGSHAVPVHPVPPSVSPKCKLNTTDNGWCCTSTDPVSPSVGFKFKCAELEGSPVLSNQCGPYAYSIKTDTNTDSSFCCVPTDDNVPKPLQQTCEKNNGAIILCPRGPGQCEAKTETNGVHMDCDQSGPFCCKYSDPGKDPSPPNGGPGINTDAHCTSLKGTLTTCQTGTQCAHNQSHMCEQGKCCEVKPNPRPVPGPPQCPANQIPEACNSGTAGCVKGYKCTPTSPPVAVASTHSYPGHMWLCVGAFGTGLVIALVLSLIRRGKK